MEQQMVDQVAAKLSSSGNQGKSTLTLNLHPPELGRLTVKLFSEDGHMSLHMHANNQQVQEVLERHMPRLRESLQQQGIELDDAMVSADSREEGGREERDDSDPRFAARGPKSVNGAPEGNEEPAFSAERTLSGGARDGISLRV
jgi:flagellar hook-length control protein FliK